LGAALTRLAARLSVAVYLIAEFGAGFPGKKASVDILYAQATQPLPPANVVTRSEGSRLFASHCASCHGLDGKGGERAPNIADRPAVHRLSDSQISHIIENGIPGTGMPAFRSLESSQVQAIVAYLRTLQGTKRAVKLPGDPKRGEGFFFGAAGCSICHMVAGKGGFIASDLSGYARTHSTDAIRNAITKPSAGADLHVRTVTAITHSGEKYSGRIRNEDNFSLQLQALDGTFHFLSKSDIERIDYDAQTLMPSDYGSRLSPQELNDVVSYLIDAARTSDSKSTKKVDDWEE
jgi:cytochrome c oxidase cbb3-type subunit 3